MGWTSTGDPYANVGEAGLTFDSAESAKAFAEKHGWNYVVGFIFSLQTRKLDALFAIATSGLFGKIEASLNGTLFNMWLWGLFTPPFIFIKLNFEEAIIGY